MRILIAPDKFKGSLTAKGVCEAIVRGIRARWPDAICISIPMADGGDGTAALLTEMRGGSTVSIRASDPLFRPIGVHYGLSPDGKAAFIDMASASGLQLLQSSEQSALNTTTLGTGELIRHALDRGVSQILLGIGGSATNDGAMGAATALGYRFLDKNGRSLRPTGRHLIDLASIDGSQAHAAVIPGLITALTDVDNVLYGEQGAAYVYASQKGASPDEIRMLDEGLQNLARVIRADLGVDVSEVAGGGAGGGFGAGAIAFFGARIRQGVDAIFDLTRIEDHVRDADIVITGEGKLDTQTLNRKLVCGLSALARRQKKRLFVVTGVNELTASQISDLGIEQVVALRDHFPPEQSVREASELIEQLVTAKFGPSLRTIN